MLNYDIRRGTAGITPLGGSSDPGVLTEGMSVESLPAVSASRLRPPAAQEVLRNLGSTPESHLHTVIATAQLLLLFPKTMRI